MVFHRQIKVFEDIGTPRQSNAGDAELIDQSKVVVIVFTANFLYHRRKYWNLRKLEKILIGERTEQVIIPVFLDTEPCDVVKDEVFVTLKHYIDKEEAVRWVDAVTKMAALPGRMFARDESVFVGMLFRKISKILDSDKPIVKRKSRCSIAMTFLVIISLLVEIASVVADQLSSVRKPYFARISLAMAIISVVLSIIDLTYNIRVHKLRFRWKWPIPWFYYPARGYNRIFASFPDTVLLFCGVAQLLMSSINWFFIDIKRREGPINISVTALFFAIGIVIFKFMEMSASHLKNN
ncbi:Toll/interleukin-1 receptor homology (TIR) domain [Arabidopsis suecica]|uniref:Toll/interleukin-1 receptor homology (TIR) domain n=1 Tax=Arabidopsis suecica TaxID=45249 RepID=A0A8T2BHP2_ARASU|nr:Toll/interleukin-1 receptor homology (TIR) domain [Arabidopsis suecica]